MALPMALSLAGLKSEEFRALLSHLMVDNEGHEDRPASPRSDSSGVSSLAFSSTRATTASSSPFSSRPETPIEDQNHRDLFSQGVKARALRGPVIGTNHTKPAAYHKKRGLIYTIRIPEDDGPKRDILDLMGNIRHPQWQMTHPDLSKGGIHNFMQNRSIYFRLSKDALSEDYPIRHCRDCDFREPSPYLCS